MSFRRVVISVPVEKRAEAKAAVTIMLRKFSPGHLEQLHTTVDDGQVRFEINLWPGQVSPFLEHLQQSHGIGIRYGVVTLLNVAAAMPPPPKPAAMSPGEKKKVGSAVSHWLHHVGREHLSAEEIHCQIEDGMEFNFNFMMMLAGASVIAAGGLASDSAVMVVASMLVSPLMGPILGCVLGFTTHDWGMLKRGAINEAKAFGFTLLFGFLSGMLISPLGKDLNWPTAEMAGRGNFANFVIGIIFAVASGIIIGLAITGGGVNSLVGVAISASLLPPVVNAGMLGAFSIFGPMLFNTEETVPTHGGTCNALRTAASGCLLPGQSEIISQYAVDAGHLFDQALWSLALFAMNVVVIGGVCALVFRFKGIVAHKGDAMAHSRDAFAASVKTKNKFRNAHKLISRGMYRSHARIEVAGEAKTSGGGSKRTKKVGASSAGGQYSEV